MRLAELFLIAVGLSMDAFAVSVCAGLSMPRATVKKSALVGLYFGGFQAAMPLIGYLFGVQFSERIERFDHWIAFALLVSIGGKMVLESRKKDRCPDRECPSGTGCADRSCPGGEELSLKPSSMLPLALATSIDALAIGVSFAFLRVQIVPAVSLIGLITFALSFLGVKIGKMFGIKYKSGAELAGGLILMLMGLKILLEHTGWL